MLHTIAIIFDLKKSKTLSKNQKFFKMTWETVGGAKYMRHGYKLRVNISISYFALHFATCVTLYDMRYLVECSRMPQIFFAKHKKKVKAFENFRKEDFSTFQSII